MVMMDNPSSPGQQRGVGEIVKVTITVKIVTVTIVTVTVVTVTVVTVTIVTVTIVTVTKALEMTMKGLCQGQLLVEDRSQQRRLKKKRALPPKSPQRKASPS